MLDADPLRPRQLITAHMGAHTGYERPILVAHSEPNSFQADVVTFGS
jgi:hypothetical protein